MGRKLDTLPSQCELLTKLVHALCETAHDDGDNATAAATRVPERHSSPAPKPWASPQRQKLILTLHVIFPDMLLSTLDLLDRKLVRRLTLTKAPSPGRFSQQDASLVSPGEARGEPSSTGRQAMYIVRSMASTLRRRCAPGKAAATRVYLVHLEAWSCSCAGFAVDAYAAGMREGMAETAAGGGDDTAAQMRKFGGLSLTGLDVHGVESTPCCKHLLACLLVDKWEDVLAAQVEDKECTAEELAGIIAGM
ncbi:hypothetical protein BM221_000866 [Beauveria bassiana]|uniref:SWIM-type domain-containing protein n=1 Tax=Beauveria bassiana TaxID=176275 RepID=A0A2N6P1P6_BEABA|nr:hypothetical protein BM221_000866 [Beauveria bassiana]